MKEKEIPFWKKEYLTIWEASQYFNIGEKNMRKVAEVKGLAVRVGQGKVFLNRAKVEKYLNTINTI